MRLYMAIWIINIKQKLHNLWEDDSGVTTIEYGLIAGLIAALLVAVFGLFGDSLKELFEAIANTLSNATDTINNERTS